MDKLENLSDEELVKELKRREKIGNRVCLFFRFLAFVLALTGLILSLISICS